MSEIIVKVGLASCGRAAGAMEVYDKLKEYLEQNEGAYILKRTGCIGMCFEEPIVSLSGSEIGEITLGKVNAENVINLIEEYRKDIIPSSNIILSDKVEAPYNDLFAYQQRIVLQNCGRIDPLSIEDYEASGGYQALRKALTLSPDEIINEVKISGLRGRGGAGFPTGLKWSFAASAKSDIKYIICNADEGDPGAFMDRSVLEGDPHRVL